MIAAEAFSRRPLDEPWRRFPWITSSALLLWASLLLGFTLVLRETGRPPETIERLDARLIDLPPAEPGGLQGAPGAPPAVVPPEPQPQAKPQVEPQRVEVPPKQHVKKKKEAPPPVYDALGAHTLPAPEGAAEGAQPLPAGEASASGGSVRGGGGGRGGLGSDSIGAHAIFAPAPKIPDDLREEVLEDVAVAHFHVGFDGDAKVTLVQTTSNPRLNSILLEALKQWRFQPAVRNGIAIESEFDVRIPISVE